MHNAHNVLKELYVNMSNSKCNSISAASHLKLSRKVRGYMLEYLINVNTKKKNASPQSPIYSYANTKIKICKIC